MPSSIDPRWVADIASEIERAGAGPSGPTLRSQHALIAKLPGLETFEVLDGVSVADALLAYATLVGVADWPDRRGTVPILRTVARIGGEDAAATLRDAFATLARG